MQVVLGQKKISFKGAQIKLCFIEKGYSKGSFALSSINLHVHQSVRHNYRSPYTLFAPYPVYPIVYFILKYVLS